MSNDFKGANHTLPIGLCNSCGKNLHTRNGVLVYTILKNPVGENRFHKKCAKDEVRPYTAQPSNATFDSYDEDNLHEDMCPE